MLLSDFQITIISPLLLLLFIPTISTSSTPQVSLEINKSLSAGITSAQSPDTFPTSAPPILSPHPLLDKVPVLALDPLAVLILEPRDEQETEVNGLEPISTLSIESTSTDTNIEMEDEMPSTGVQCSPGSPYCDPLATMLNSFPSGTNTYVVPVVTSMPGNPFLFSVASGPLITPIPSTSASSISSSIGSALSIGNPQSSSTMSSPAHSTSTPTHITTGSITIPTLDPANKGGIQLTKHQTNQVVGGTVGGSLALLALFGMIFLACARSRRRRRQMLDDEEYQEVEESYTPPRPMVIQHEPYNPRSIPPLTNPFADPVDYQYPPPLPRFSSIQGDGRLSRLSFSQFSPPAPLPTLDEAPEPPLTPPLTPPPVVLRAAQLHGEGSINDTSVTDLPETLGRLSTWLKENRRRSRVVSIEFDDDVSVDSVHSLSR